MSHRARPADGLRPPLPRADDAALFRLLVERIADYAIFLLTPDGHIASWNTGAERLKGYTADEIIGQHFERFYTAEARAAGRPRRMLEMARRDGRCEDEGWRVRKDGSLFWADVVVTALYDESGTLRGYAKITRDLTARRATEEQLRQSEERFRTLVGSVKDYAIFMLSPDGIVLTWNQGAERLKGYAPEEIIGQSFERFYTEDARAAGRPQRLLAIAAADGRVEDEGWRVRKDGSLFWADVVITALRDHAGELTGFAKVTRDLTERHQAEQDRTARLTAERTAQRFERLQKATAALAVASEPESAAAVLADVSAHAMGAAAGVVAVRVAECPALEVVGISGHPATPFGIQQQVPLDGANPLAYAWRANRALVIESRSQLEREYPELSVALSSSSHQAWSIVPMVMDQRTIGVVGLSFTDPRRLDPDELGFLLALVEVGAQALDRARLYAAEQRARSEAQAAEKRARDEAELVETLHEVSLALSAELNLESVVQAATDAAASVTCAEFGVFIYNFVGERGEEYPPYTVSGESHGPFDDFRWAPTTPVLEPAISGQGVVRSDDIQQDPRYRDRPGMHDMPPWPRPVRSYLAVPVTSKEGDVLGGLFFGHRESGIFNDRSERLATGIAAQAAVAIENARLYLREQQAVRTRDEFLAAAAHDLKTPLATTKGVAQLLRSRILRLQIPDGERIVDGLTRIDRSVERMTLLIDELLDLARLQMGRPLDLERQPTDLPSLVRQVLTDHQPSAPRHTLRIEAKDDPLVGVWDPVRLRRVLDNLISNAIKYSPDGGEILVRVERVAVDGRVEAVVSVTDHGVGIPVADRPHVFERFRRGANVGFAQGTGIGLGIVQTIVQEHGGSVGVNSVENTGSTFTVRLPLE